MVRRTRLLSSGLVFLTVVCFVSNIVFIIHHVSVTHKSSAHDVQQRHDSDEHYDQAFIGNDPEMNKDISPEDKDVLLPKRKGRRRPDLNQDHKNHHHGEANQEAANSDIQRQVEESKDKMNQFLVEKHGGGIEPGVDEGNKAGINQEMMMKFFDGQAALSNKDIKLAHQELLRNAMAAKSAQKGANGMPINCTEVKKEPYFENPREVDKDVENGLGAMGGRGKIEHMTNDEVEHEKEGYKHHSFNEFLSQKISLHRSLRDPRYPECRDLKYPKDLPKTSIVICFHNEAWSTLLRTLHSILDRTPHHLIEEILFIDDGSLMDHLREPLEDYIANIHVVRIRIIRTKERIGLIRARVLGAEMMTGEILTFLDSHIEASVGWLEPLLARIAENRTHVAVPVVDAISDKDFSYGKTAEPIERGGFNWRLGFRWKPTPDYYNRDKTSPIRSPAMPGGLFSMDRDYFFKLGTYDPGMMIWGGENIEESLKVWMCGGTIEILPCSRVGHIFRSTPPYNYQGKRPLDVVERNSRRVAEVWMDDYKDQFLERLPHLKNKEYGDVSDRIELRKKLGCKSFEWYLDEVYPELYRPNIQTDLQRTAMLRNIGIDMCVDSNDQDGHPGKKLIFWHCHGQGGNQYFELTADGEMRNDELCLESDNTGGYVVLNLCSKRGEPVSPKQKWIYKEDGKLYNPSTLACMSASGIKSPGTPVELKICGLPLSNQKWQFS